MGGACRETYSIRRNPRAFFRLRTWFNTYAIELIVKDNIAWIVCVFRGHQPYNTSMKWEDAEHACRTCGRWLPFLDPPKTVALPGPEPPHKEQAE